MLVTRIRMCLLQTFLLCGLICSIQVSDSLKSTVDTVSVSIIERITTRALLEVFSLMLQWKFYNSKRKLQLQLRSFFSCSNLGKRMCFSSIFSPAVPCYCLQASFLTKSSSKRTICITNLTA